MSGRLWGGRFQGELDERIDRLNRSFPFDRRLYAEDLEGSAAWAKALQAAGILSRSDLRSLLRGLTQIRREFDEGRFKPKPADEDIHTAVERRLGEIAGAAAQRLHTGRSRNDQVATDLNLWLKRASEAAIGSLAVLAKAILRLAERAGETAIPAYTHLQRAQPVLAAHHLLAYVEMLSRDRERFVGAMRRADVLPLGCGAATGTSVRVDRRALARDLGFRAVARNSLDAVGSRDAPLEFLGACTVLATHLSRLGEEIVLWASAEFGFLRLADTVATGSSLLPQKKNPDGAELARGKAGRVLGRYVALATALKGLPLAYNKDVQEDKEACFEAADTMQAILAALTATVDGCAFDEARCAEALEGGHLLAVEIADYLVSKGLPFREAHELVGRLVQRAEALGVDVSALPLEEMQKVSLSIERDVAKCLTVPAALRTRRAMGGTAPSRVRRELQAWSKRLARWT